MRPEQAAAALAARREAGAVLRRLGGVRGVLAAATASSALRKARGFVRELFEEEPKARSEFLHHHSSRIGPLFAALDDDDRRRLTRMLLPRLGPAIDAAWPLLANRPYQLGPMRKPFRSPRSPKALAETRGRWLLNIALILAEYDEEIGWVAAWAPHLASGYDAVDLGWLLAGAIDAGGAAGEAVLGILKASASGEHEVGGMGRHVIQALLSCGRPEAWEFVEGLLLAAQREEGLRQAILESVDEAHPEAFPRMLRLIRAENLSRFASVVRAADTWFGFLWDGTSAIEIDGAIDRVLHLLGDRDACMAALEDRDAETVYLALWSLAFEAVDVVVLAAARLLASDSTEIRFVATHLLVQSDWTVSLPHLVEMLGDADLRVAARALDAFGANVTAWVDGERLVSQLEALLERLPQRPKVLGGLVWPWWSRKLERKQVTAALVANAPAVPPERLLPNAPKLEAGQREELLSKLAGVRRRWGRGEGQERKPLAEPVRQAALALLGDSSPQVRRTAFDVLESCAVQPDEVERLVDLLGRKAGDLRSACLARLRLLSDRDLLAAAEILLADRLEPRRLAGLELLRAAIESNRAVTRVRERVARYQAERSGLSAAEESYIAAVQGARGEVASKEDGLGLCDPAALRAWPAPRPIAVELDTLATRASLKSLAESILAHQQIEVRTPEGDTVLLLETAIGFSWTVRRAGGEERENRIPLGTVWKDWALNRPEELRDQDGLELVRARMAERDSPPWQAPEVRQLVGSHRASAGGQFLGILLGWCIFWEKPARALDFLLDGLEQSLAQLTAEEYEILEDGLGLLYDETRRRLDIKLTRVQDWLREVRWWTDDAGMPISPEQSTRLYGLLRYFQSRTGGYFDLQVTPADFLGAYRAGAIDANEFIDLLVGNAHVKWAGSLLVKVSGRRLPAEYAGYPELLEAVERCRRRVVEVETARGDSPTAASDLALRLRWSGGLETLSRALEALGADKLTRSPGWYGRESSRQDTLSRLIFCSAPREQDTPEAFAEWAQRAGIKTPRLVELALLTPQWAAHVSHFLGWPGLEGAVWWLHAHTKERALQHDELQELWVAEVSERTPLSAAELLEGAVDVAWFREVYGKLGPERWRTIDAAAKYAASRAGHTRAQLFARTMSGSITRAELVERIESKRHQDTVRALGLLPLEEGAGRDVDLLERYQLLQRFRRESRKFGAQRRESETRAAATGLANLARTAGYRDPQRLQWAMEREAVADLVAGPVVCVRGDLTVELSISSDGKPKLVAERAGKVLKSIPATLKNDPEIAELRDRLQELRRQGSRVRGALEEAMCRGDSFTGAELRELLAHPILAPSFSRLVFVGEGAAGYLAEEGRALRDHSGALHAIGGEEPLRVAHPLDLFQRGDWSAWQRECFSAERIQPFKQVFRELYPVTETERAMHRSLRYAGHQVKPQQALALLDGRGWTVRPEEGVSRTFHDDGLTVRLAFQQAFQTPAEVEGLTLEAVVFTRKGEWEALPLAEVPPRVFSEAMRDLDLVVSVAHQGGVDPEATASTIEMRAALVRETCALLGLGNVEVKTNHALVRGELATYSIHLGSAGVQVMPGTSLPIVAVHSQHRGRLFLPFADDDPRTAEVLSKLLLLARDRGIRDPSILERIRGARGGG